ncbi:MAG: hypothetical protein H6817_06495 [Phycisphaerales bacterium]|nr:hypothetical protein [Phycisphaerales bacterium]
MFCLKCAYPLDHLPAPKCPECGTPFDIRIPWSYELQANRLPFQRPRLARWALMLAIAHGLLTYSAVILAMFSMPGAFASAATLFAGIVTLPAGVIFILLGMPAHDVTFVLIATANSLFCATGIAIAIEYHRTRWLRRPVTNNEELRS